MDATESDQSEVLESLRAHFISGKTRSFASRLDALNRIERLVRENTDEICRALFEDLRKPKQEAVISEIALSLRRRGAVRAVASVRVIAHHLRGAE